MKKFKYKLNGQIFEANKLVDGREVLENAGLQPADEYELLLKITGKEFEPIQLGENVDLSIPVIEEFFAKPYKSFTVLVDDEPVEFNECFVTPTEILKGSGKEPGGYYLKQVVGHRQINYKNDPNHKIALRNKLKFSTCRLKPTTVS